MKIIKLEDVEEPMKIYLRWLPCLITDLHVSVVKYAIESGLNVDVTSPWIFLVKKDLRYGIRTVILSPIGLRVTLGTKVSMPELSEQVQKMVNTINSASDTSPYGCIPKISTKAIKSVVEHVTKPARLPIKRILSISFGPHIDPITGSSPVRIILDDSNHGFFICEDIPKSYVIIELINMNFPIVHRVWSRDMGLETDWLAVDSHEQILSFVEKMQMKMESRCTIS